ncbi:hypothetical protein AN218_06055, partial [Streptomyces nanshensis]
MKITGRSAGSGLRAAAARTASRAVRPDGNGRGSLVAFGALAAADLAAVAGDRPRGLRRAAKPLLMPALASYVLRRRADADSPAPAP